MRFYGFKINEILNKENPHLDTDIDPKLSWALRNLQVFPLNINTAGYSQIIRVPGIGRQSAMKIIEARKFGQLHIYQLQKIGIAYNRAKYFTHCADSPFELGNLQPHRIKDLILGNSTSKYLKTPQQQLSLF
jgi:predicted DNA-binding helix-hairpin-helix protein